MFKLLKSKTFSLIKISFSSTMFHKFGFEREREKERQYFWGLITDRITVKCTLTTELKSSALTPGISSNIVFTIIKPVKRNLYLKKILNNDNSHHINDEDFYFLTESC